MEEILELYETRKKEGDIFQYRFGLPVESDDLEKLEKYFDYMLPEQYRTFLLNYDGGFICNGHWGEYIWETGSDSLPYSRSICFYTAQEVMDNIYITESIEEMFNISNIDYYTVIPVAVTPENKTLIMNADKDSPIFFYDGVESIWSIKELYPDLKSFLKEYIENEGYIKELF